ncbi:MAG TPA: methyltransferase domain-containing protein [Ignavibacteriaceae bacterium]
MSYLIERSAESEWMDDFSISSPDLKETLKNITFINKYFGGHRSVILGLSEIFNLNYFSSKKSIRIVEIGCGLGDNLLVIEHKFGKKFKLELVGIDANQTIIEEAKSNDSLNKIEFICSTLNSTNITEIEADVLVFGLFLHHFSEVEITSLLNKIDPRRVKSIIISDLQRSTFSLFLFKLASAVFNFNKMAYNDGIISIKKGFTLKEINGYLDAMKIEPLVLKKVFGFRILMVGILK